jgi:hypothetical protein
VHPNFSLRRLMCYCLVLFGRVLHTSYLFLLLTGWKVSFFTDIA